MVVFNATAINVSDSIDTVINEGFVPDAVIYAMYGICIFLIVFGNLLVIVAVILEPKLRVSSTNILIVSLAFSDLLVGSYYIPSLIMWSEALYLMVNPVICNIDGLIQLTSTGSSVFTLIAIAADRFRAIVTPLKPKITRTQAVIMVAVAWTCAITYALYIPITWEYQIYVYHVGNVTHEIPFCFFLKKYEPLFKPLRLCDFVVLFLIPLCILICLYVPMIYKLWFDKQPTSTTGGRKKRAIKMLSIVVIVFFLLWLPFYSLYFYSFYGNLDHPTINIRAFGLAAICLNFSNSWVNPIIYGCFNENFRNAYKNTVLCRIWSISRRIHPSMADNTDRSSDSRSRGHVPIATRNTLLTVGKQTTSANSSMAPAASQVPCSFVMHAGSTNA
ncbi:neuropeptide FF receptor 2-like [Saccoglossus kowalevskii]|uniref:Neuropeptide FF receptor 2-like n=1 Tax=Saccoglossus kowalevskii TaxID=10224 RepID=A0ABM0LWP4_SACKO|nr:PREDICTED: neuropeptide FF receptor 2-like [Saccoglossus kowalevskii]